MSLLSPRFLDILAKIDRDKVFKYYILLVCPFFNYCFFFLYKNHVFFGSYFYKYLSISSADQYRTICTLFHPFILDTVFWLFNFGTYWQLGQFPGRQIVCRSINALESNIKQMGKKSHLTIKNKVPLRQWFLFKYKLITLQRVPSDIYFFSNNLNHFYRTFLSRYIRTQ